MSVDNKNCVDFSNVTKSPIRQITRLREDSCYKNLRDETSVKPGEYSSGSYYDCTCEALNTKELSLQQPAMFFKDGYGWTSKDGCNIDKDAKLRNAYNLTNKRDINQYLGYLNDSGIKNLSKMFPLRPIASRPGENANKVSQNFRKKIK